MGVYNFGTNGSNLTKLFHVTCREAGMIIWVQLFGGPPPLLKFGRAKASKIPRDFGRLQTLIAIISEMD